MDGYQNAVSFDDAANRERRLLVKLDFGEEGAGGFTVCYRSRHTGYLHITADQKECGTGFLLPAAAEERALLFSFDRPLFGEKELCISLDAAGIQIRSVKFHRACEVSVGKNPLTCLDFPDIDVIRVDDVYYMISTTMYFMPGGVILRSFDLIHWEYAARIYDVLEDTPAQRLDDGKGAYSSGMWAASLRYHDGMFYVSFVANDTQKTYLYRASQITGPWKRNYIEGFFMESSLLFDDDGKTYIVHGHRQIYLTELNEELTAPKPGGLNRMIADFGDSRQLPYEGIHFYRINGKYCLFMIHSLRDRWRRVETCLVSDSLEGEFTGGIVFDDDMGFFGQGIAQGGVVDTPDGRWFAILFQDRGSCGRIPILLPMAWEDGHPVIGINGRTPETVANLTTRPGWKYAPLISGDTFEEEKPLAVWEWNHIPKQGFWKMGGGRFSIQTDRVGKDLTLAHNTLTQRALFPKCAASVTVDGSLMQEGDIAGLCVLQYRWAYIGLEKTKDGFRLIVCTRTLDEEPEGAVCAVAAWPSERAELRILLDFTDLKDTAEFCYRQDGSWVSLGEAHKMAYLLKHFTGNRFGLFAMSGEKAGGSASFERFIYEKEGEANER